MKAGEEGGGGGGRGGGGRKSADMPVYLGISCVKGGRGERRGGGGGRVEKEVESSTTLAGVTLEELEQTLLGKKQGGEVGEGEAGAGEGVPMSILRLVSLRQDGQAIQLWIDESILPIIIIGKITDVAKERKKKTWKNDKMMVTMKTHENIS